MSEIDPSLHGGNFFRDTEIILRRQAESLSDALSANPSEAQRFRSGIELDSIAEPSSYCVFPARIKSNNADSSFVFQFDVPTFDYLVETFSSSYQITASELAEVYIGTGIASYLLQSRLRQQTHLRTAKMLNVLTDASPIMDAIRTTDFIPEELRHDALLSMAQSESKRVGNINVLRFAFGMLYMQPEQATGVADLDEQYTALNSRESRLMKLFQDGLVETIEQKPKYMMLGEIFNRDELVSDKVFADSIGELEFAACFPMKWQEIRNLLGICKTS